MSRTCLPALVASSLLSLSACARQAAPTTSAHTTVRPSTSNLTVQLTTTAQSNGGRPVYYALRELSAEAGFAEGYEAVLAQTLESAAAPGVLAQGLMSPNETLTQRLTVAEGVDLAVYVFFTARESAWKLRVPKPLPRELAFSIETQRIVDAPAGSH